MACVPLSDFYQGASDNGGWDAFLEVIILGLLYQGQPASPRTFAAIPLDLIHNVSLRVVVLKNVDDQCRQPINRRTKPLTILETVMNLRRALHTE